MRILVMILTLGLIAAWSPVTTAQAQCSMLCPIGKDAKAKQAKAKLKKPATVKKIKKEKVEYMKAAG